jgi:cyclophilin family peptidyl-prolyl cis-trans isomerase
MFRAKNGFLVLMMLSGLFFLQATRVCGQIVRFRTNVGNIDVRLLPQSAPQTVANFLRYVDAGRYNGTFVHRSVPNFVIQGGGYKFVNNQTETVTTYPSVVNEFAVSNTRGTLAMAKFQGDPNSATSQWFFNVVDNSANLDTQNGGYTVFGRIVDQQGLSVMDALGGVPIYNFGGAFDSLPLINYSGSGPVDASNLVTVYSIGITGKPFDFSRDGRADLSVFRPSNGTWYINPSDNPNALTGAQFGLNTDKIAPADYDGDGKTDIAVWRAAEGNFYILNSSNSSVRIENFGLSNDLLTVGDWDGDGKADLSTYREGTQSYFFYRGSLNNPNGNITYLPWGTSGDKPLRGDFDADGKQDSAVYRGSDQTWYIRNSSNSQVQYITFGNSTDKFVPADYDGDGKTDAAVFRPSNSVWYILQSSNSQVRYETFGLSSDTLSPADYDGDGKADIAVFRNGTWSILQSSNNQILYSQFGQPGDIPAASAFMP